MTNKSAACLLFGVFALGLSTSAQAQIPCRAGGEPNGGDNTDVVREVTIKGGIESLAKITEKEAGCVSAAFARAIPWLWFQQDSPEGDLNHKTAKEINEELSDDLGYDPGGPDTDPGFPGGRKEWMAAKKTWLEKYKVPINTKESSALLAGDWEKFLDGLMDAIENGAAVELQLESHFSMIWKMREMTNGTYEIYIADDRSGPDREGQGDSVADTSSRGPFIVSTAGGRCRFPSGKPCGQRILGALIETLAK